MTLNNQKTIYFGRNNVSFDFYSTELEDGEKIISYKDVVDGKFKPKTIEFSNSAFYTGNLICYDTIIVNPSNHAYSIGRKEKSICLYMQSDNDNPLFIFSHLNLDIKSSVFPMSKLSQYDVGYTISAKLKSKFGFVQFMFVADCIYNGFLYKRGEMLTVFFVNNESSYYKKLGEPLITTFIDLKKKNAADGNINTYYLNMCKDKIYQLFTNALDDSSLNRFKANPDITILQKYVYRNGLYENIIFKLKRKLHKPVCHFFTYKDMKSSRTAKVVFLNENKNTLTIDNPPSDFHCNASDALYLNIRTKETFPPFCGQYYDVNKSLKIQECRKIEDHNVLKLFLYKNTCINVLNFYGNCTTQDATI